MKPPKMLTEKEISIGLGRVIKSPISIGSLQDLGMDSNDFIRSYQPFFNQLEGDVYLVREKQVEFLQKAFPNDLEQLNRCYKDYFEGRVSLVVFENWIERLTESQNNAFEQLSYVTRYRNISSFVLCFNEDSTNIKRVENEDYAQEVTDFRSWQRVFSQAPSEAVESQSFNTLLLYFGKKVKEIHPEVKQLKFTAHFMRICSNDLIKAENSPEGIHEDGVDYIVSALVVKRHNCSGATSQIFELIDGQKELLFEKDLREGEFIFQADTGEEEVFGNDLWHHVTALYPSNISDVAIRDIIGFDIKIVN